MFLWSVPAFMIVIILAGVVRAIYERMPAIFALSGTVGGSLAAYLMIQERAITNNAPRLVAIQWPAVFWLSVAASVGIVAAAFISSTR